MGSGYNRSKDHYKPYSSYGYSGSKNRNESAGSSRPAGFGNDDNKRSYNTSSYYQPKKSSMFESSHNGRFGGGGNYNGGGSGYSNSGKFGNDRPMFAKRYNSQPNPNKGKGSVYIHDANKKPKEEGDHNNRSPDISQGNDPNVHLTESGGPKDIESHGELKAGHNGKPELGHEKSKLESPETKHKSDVLEKPDTEAKLAREEVKVTHKPGNEKPSSLAPSEPQEPSLKRVNRDKHVPEKTVKKLKLSEQSTEGHVKQVARANSNPELFSGDHKISKSLEKRHDSVTGISGEAEKRKESHKKSDASLSPRKHSLFNENKTKVSSSIKKSDLFKGKKSSLFAKKPEPFRPKTMSGLFKTKKAEPEKKEEKKKQAEKKEEEKREGKREDKLEDKKEDKVKDLAANEVKESPKFNEAKKLEKLEKPVILNSEPGAASVKVESSRGKIRIEDDEDDEMQDTEKANFPTNESSGEKVGPVQEQVEAVKQDIDGLNKKTEVIESQKLTSPKFGKAEPKDLEKPSSQVFAGLKSSPLSDINISRDHELDDDEEEIHTSRKRTVTPEQKSFDQRAKRVLETDDDSSENSEGDFEDGNIGSDAETVVADYPPRSRRGRGRLVRKSEYENSSASSSRSRERKKAGKNHKVIRDPSGRLKLQIACDKGKYELAKQLIEEGADVNDTDYAGNSSLHEAALKGRYKITQLLIQHGADVNLQSGPEDLDTPLIDAAANGHLNVVQLLLDHGANPNISNAVNENIYEILKEEDDRESKALLKELLKKKDKHYSQKSIDGSAEDEASGSDSEDETERQKKADQRYNQNRNDLFWLDLTSRSGRNEIYKRVDEGDFAYVASYLSGGGKPDTEALVSASAHGHSDIVNILLAFGAKINGQVADGSTAIMNAVGNRHLATVQLLLDNGADPSRRRKADGKNAVEICQESVIADEEEIALLKKHMGGSSKKFEKERKVDEEKRSEKDDRRSDKEEKRSDKEEKRSDREDKKKEVKKEVEDDDKRKEAGKVRNPVVASKDVSLKTSKLFSGPKEERKLSNVDSKMLEKIEKEQDMERKELYEQQKQEKIRARQQAVLLRISQVEKQREEERKLQKLQEEEKLRKDKLDAEERERLLKQQQIEVQQQKENESKRRIRDNYPYGIRSLDFYNYKSLGDLGEAARADVQESFKRFSPVYFAEINGTKYVVDLQVILVTRNASLIDNYPGLAEGKVLVKDEQQLKLWNFFGSFLMQDMPEFSGTERGLGQKLEVFNEEGKKFQKLALHWIKLDAVEKDVLRHMDGLELVQLDYEYLASTELASCETNASRPLSVEHKAGGLPRKFHGRSEVVKAINSFNKRIW